MIRYLGMWGFALALLWIVAGLSVMQAAVVGWMAATLALIRVKRIALRDYELRAWDLALVSFLAGLIVFFMRYGELRHEGLGHGASTQSVLLSGVGLMMVAGLVAMVALKVAARESSKRS